MEEIFVLSASDKIALLTAVITALVGCVSIIISVLTLRQNSKMIEEEVRPYITVYGGSTQFGNPKFYVIVKNFGKSAATIENFSYHPNLCTFLGKKPFQSIEGMTLAPGQTIYAPIKLIGIDHPPETTFTIRYRWGKKTYTEKATLNIAAYAEYESLRENRRDLSGDIKVISYTLQDLVEKQL